MRNVIGVDGCKKGWIAVRRGNNASYEIRVFPSICEVWKWRKERDLVLIDIPIGLHDRGPEQRMCDVHARKLLGARSPCVFTPPARRALAARSWEKACELNEKATGRRLSKQAWGICKKIEEVDTFLRGNPQVHAHLREVHPELLFQVLNGGMPMQIKKSTVDGRNERLAVLARHEPRVDELVEQAREIRRGTGAKVDDFIDALVSVIAALACKGRLQSIPTRPVRDKFGLRMEMLVPYLAA